MLLSFPESTIYFVLVILTSYQVNTQNTSVIRGAYDVFTNLADSCDLMKAVCFDKNCTLCRCEGEKRTFVPTRGEYGECVQNRFLVYVTSYQSSFVVQETTYNSCLHYQTSNRNVKTNQTCNTSARSQRWLWTKNGQLVNLDALQCITVGEKYSYTNIYQIILDECVANNRRQSWTCDQDDLSYVRIQENKRYMDIIYKNFVVLSNRIKKYVRKWQRYDSNEEICSEAVGCETFQDGSSLLILNQTTKCQHNSNCLGEKEIDIGRNVTECTLLSNQTQYLHKDEWKPLLAEEKSFNVFTRENNPFLKWNLVKTPKSWQGLIVKVKFRCGNGAINESTEQIHCVLIKYTGLFTGFEKSDGNKQPGKDEKAQTTVIIVCVLVITIIIGLVVFFAYRNKSRLSIFLTRYVNKEDKTRNPSPRQKSGKSANPIYRSSERESAQSNCELYEPAPEPVYQCVNAGHETEAQQQKFTYDYALPDDHQSRAVRDGQSTGGNKISQNASGSQNTDNSSHVYHVLEK